MRREFLGEVRCLVFDFTPLPKSGKGRFKGRVWVEDQNYTIVRFNGVYTPIAGINGFNLHFDSWRMNVQPGLWLPAYVFSQESDLKDFLGNHVRFKSQTRLWGYDLKNASHQEELSELTIESPNAIQGQAAQQQDRSPIEAEREWQHQAEVNVLDRLQRVGLLCASGRRRQGSRDLRQQPRGDQQSRHPAGSSLPRASHRHSRNRSRSATPSL